MPCQVSALSTPCWGSALHTTGSLSVLAPGTILPFLPAPPSLLLLLPPLGPHLVTSETATNCKLTRGLGVVGTVPYCCACCCCCRLASSINRSLRQVTPPPAPKPSNWASELQL